MSTIAKMPFGHAVGFLLTQLGYAISRKFGADLESLALEPRHFGVLRAINAAGHPTQQAMGEMLHLPASTVVALVDSLEKKGLVRRAMDPDDRRVRLVELTEAGQSALVKATEVAFKLEGSLCAEMTSEEREALVARLQQLATHLGLTIGVHPGAHVPQPPSPPEDGPY